LFDSKLDHNSALHAKIREKSLLIESRIEFPYPILMTLDRRKISGKISFSPLWVLIKKLDRNSGLHAKNQRDISSNKVRRLLWPLGRGKCGKGGGNGIRRGGNGL
jgi:hypothetical protein